MLLFVLAGTAFLAILVLIVFVVLVVSIHRAARVPLSETRGKRSGTIARRVLTGFRIDGEEGTE